MTDLLADLRAHGLLYQATAEPELARHLETPGRLGYVGFDPSSDSLTIGNLVPIKLLMHWQRAGHTPIVVMGGGTGLIGDPSGKDRERQLLSRDEVDANVRGQMRVFERMLDFGSTTSNAAVLVNNIDWLDELRFIDVLRDVGKHFSINAMIQKDSVRERLHEREQGISYTEFSYMILQAYDFLHLRRAMNCTVQMAGSDQYGNIVAGIDLIRREFGGADADTDGGPGAFGFTAPLLLTADGKKVGKSEQGSVYLTADRTSPYQFYQYWINIEDAEVERYLKWFTFLETDEIADVMTTHTAAPHERGAQRKLACIMTEMIHGDGERERVETASHALFSGGVRDLDEGMLGEVFADVPGTTHDRAALSGEGLSLVELLPETSLASSKREAREFLANGAISLNGEKVAADYAITRDDLLHDRTVLLRRGKKKWHALRFGS